MSDTPETDANQRIVLGGVGGDWKVVLADFARNLERQRNDARAEAARLQMELDASCNAEELRQAREENAICEDTIKTMNDALKEAHRIFGNLGHSQVVKRLCPDFQEIAELVRKSHDQHA